MVIIDILIYVFFAWVMSTFAKKSYKYYPNSIRLDRFLVQYILFYTIISAIRWRVGADSVGYAKDFIVGTMGADAEGAVYKELISQFIVHTVHDIGLHFTIGVGILSFLEIYFITKILARYKFILVYMPIVLFGSRYYANEMNGMRQMIVASAFVLFSKFIYERKAIKYLLSIFLSTMVHQSSIMLLPLFFLPKKITEIADKRLLLLGIFFACFIVGQSPQFKMLTEYGETIGIMMGYENYSTMLVEKVDSNFEDEKKSLGPIMMSFLVVALSNIYFGGRLKKRYESIIPYFNLWYFFSFLWGCLYFLFCNAGVLLSRPWLYFCLFEMIIFTLVLYDLMQMGKRLPKYRTIAMGLVLAAWVSTSYGIIKAANNPKNDWASYKFFFMHMDEVNAIKNNRL